MVIVPWNRCLTNSQQIIDKKENLVRNKENNSGMLCIIGHSPWRWMMDKHPKGWRRALRKQNWFFCWKLLIIPWTVSNGRDIITIAIKRDFKDSIWTRVFLGNITRKESLANLTHRTHIEMEQWWEVSNQINDFFSQIDVSVIVIIFIVDHLYSRIKVYYAVL